MEGHAGLQDSVIALGDVHGAIGPGRGEAEANRIAEVPRAKYLVVNVLHTLFDLDGNLVGGASGADVGVKQFQS